MLRIAPTQNAAEQKRRTLAEKHLGIIAERCKRHWASLPPRVRASYDMEDMLGDAVAHVLTVQHKHDPKRAKESTFVFHVADNKCKSILAKYSSKKVTPPGELLDLEDLSAIEDPDAEARLQEAKNAVERVIERGSDRVCDVVEFLVYGRGGERVNAEGAAELKSTARSCGALFEDFYLVHKYLGG